jgi:hypothetical protein
MFIPGYAIPVCRHIDGLLSARVYNYWFIEPQYGDYTGTATHKRHNPWVKPVHATTKEQ